MPHLIPGPLGPMNTQEHNRIIRTALDLNAASDLRILLLNQEQELADKIDVATAEIQEQHRELGELCDEHNSIQTARVLAENDTKRLSAELIAQATRGGVVLLSGAAHE